MTDLLFRLIDRAIDLAKRRERQRSDFYKNFVEPTWRDFEAVHQNYLSTFQRYAELVADTKIHFDQSHSVFRAIELDSLLSDAMRSKLAEADSLTDLDTRLHAFVGEIIAYLDAIPSESMAIAEHHQVRRSPKWLAPMCLPRICLKEALRYSVEGTNDAEEARQTALRCIADAIQCLQIAHRGALQAYNGLKLDLLTPTRPF